MDHKFEGIVDVTVGMAIVIEWWAPKTFTPGFLKLVSWTSVAAQALRVPCDGARDLFDRDHNLIDVTRLTSLRIASLCVHIQMLTRLNWIETTKWAPQLTKIMTGAGFAYASLFITSPVTGRCGLLRDLVVTSTVIGEHYLPGGRWFEGGCYLTCGGIYTSNFF